jgi:BirA family biotin operon repressor/biotin-[acetyl-CoA-carboxylase] ligase
MDQSTITSSLADLNLGVIRYYPSIDSTNDEALRLAEVGVPDLSLVIADEQRAGKGRAGRLWLTPVGSAIAFSLILPPPSDMHPSTLSRFTALGTLAVCDALIKAYGLDASIKWPNDVILERRKVSGILTEAHWNGDQLVAIILGIGINVASTSIEVLEALEPSVRYPATCIEAHIDGPADRMSLLRNVLIELLTWHPKVTSPEFIQEWEARLAFRDETVYITQPLTPIDVVHPQESGRILGLAPDGSLKFRRMDGKILTIPVGELHLRPNQELISTQK